MRIVMPFINFIQLQSGNLYLNEHSITKAEDTEMAKSDVKYKHHCIPIIKKYN